LRPVGVYDTIRLSWCHIHRMTRNLFKKKGKKLWWNVVVGRLFFDIDQRTAAGVVTVGINPSWIGANKTGIE
jgi:hypothetical protein